MIKVENENVETDGTGKEVFMDVVRVIIAFFKILSKEFDTKRAYEAVIGATHYALEEINRLIDEGEEDGD